MKIVEKWEPKVMGEFRYINMKTAGGDARPTCRLNTLEQHSEDSEKIVVERMAGSGEDPSTEPTRSLLRESKQKNNPADPAREASRRRGEDEFGGKTPDRCQDRVTANSLLRTARGGGGMPHFILQCQDVYVSRIMSYLHLKYPGDPEHAHQQLSVGGAVGGVYSGKISCCPSNTEVSSTSERLILIHAVSQTQGELGEERGLTDRNVLQADLFDDENVSATVVRLYRFDGPTAQAFVTIDDVCAWVVSLGPPLSDSLRIHTFPAAVKQDILHKLALAVHEGGWGGKLDPTAAAEHVLSVVFANGCYMASVQPRAAVFIGDMRGQRAKRAEDCICRAMFKLEEVFRRARWLTPPACRASAAPCRTGADAAEPDGTPAATQSECPATAQGGPIAIDIGASPGGWSKYLSEAVRCSKVTAVDPGNVVCNSAAVQHLRMNGQQALELLKQQQPVV